MLHIPAHTENPKNYGIELWIDSGNRLMLSDPERLPNASNAQIKEFRLPVANGTGLFGHLIFEHSETIKGRRVFQATALYAEPDPEHSQSALWSDVLGLLLEEI